MDSSDWLLPLGADDPAALDAALDLIEHDASFPDFSGLQCASSNGSSSFPTGRQLRLLRGDSMELAAANATVAFLDNFDDDTEDEAGIGSDRCSRAATLPPSSVTSSSEEGAATSAESSTKPARRNRVRPKEELAQLKRQEGELASKLHDLRLEARRRAVKPRKGSGGNANGRGSALLFWERAASLQLRHRQESEQENRRLTGLLRGHIRHARQLQQAVRRQLKASSASDAVGDDCFSPAARAVPTNNDSVFADLLADLDATYATLDPSGAPSVIKRVGDGDSLSPIDGSLHAKSIFLDHNEATTVPFELRVAQQALWRSIGSQPKWMKAKFLRTLVNYAGDVLRTSSCSSIFFNDGHPFFLRYQMVARMYKEVDRVVVISKARAEPRTFEQGVFLGATFLETNVRVLTPANCDGDPFTTVQVHASLTREVFNSPFSEYWGEDDHRSTKEMWAATLANRREALDEFLVTTHAC